MLCLMRSCLEIFKHTNNYSLRKVCLRGIRILDVKRGKVENYREMKLYKIHFHKHSCRTATSLG